MRRYTARGDRALYLFGLTLGYALVLVAVGSLVIVLARMAHYLFGLFVG